MTNYCKAGVIGGGAWGTALATVAARAGLSVLLQARETEVVDEINSRHSNSLFLPDVPLNPTIRATTEMADLADCDLILAVAPAQHMRSALAALSPVAREGLPVILCAKGIERGTNRLMNDVLTEALPHARGAVLSGPSFAGEVARGLPAAVTLACSDAALGADLAKAIATPKFRPYVSNDVIGAEAGGALKNVLAIACGIAEGRGLGRNAHAALITRGFAEVTRFAGRLGARPETVAGLCGLGDLVLTCSSSQSRNMSVGLALGAGQTLDQALSGKLSVAEGVESAPAVRSLARELDVELPICEAVASILAGETCVDGAIERLLARPLKSEW